MEEMAVSRKYHGNSRGISGGNHFVEDRARAHQLNAQVAFAASRDDVTPVLTGVQLEVSGTTLSLVATGDAVLQAIGYRRLER